MKNVNLHLLLLHLYSYTVQLPIIMPRQNIHS